MSAQIENLHSTQAASEKFSVLGQAELNQLVAAATSLPMLAQTLLAEQTLSSGESCIAHAEGVVGILEKLGFDADALHAAWLFQAMAQLHPYEKTIKPVLLNQFSGQGETASAFWQLAQGVHKLASLESITRSSNDQSQSNKKQIDGLAIDKNDLRQQAESLRKMLLAFAQDIRVVIIYLASRLQSMRFYAAAKITPPPEVPREGMNLLAPLANRLGIGQIKWEIEDLAFRFTEPEIYKKIARLLDEKRIEREQFIEQISQRIRNVLAAEHIRGEVTGRPKNIYSIYKKMRDKNLTFEALHDVRAFRVIVEDIKSCYSVLSVIHHLWTPITAEFDDYIARPKPNGYKSLHTVVIDENNKNFEVQVRTYEMHQFAEYGVAAHWRYKELGARGFSGSDGFISDGEQKKYDEKIALFRQLLAWKTDVEKGKQTLSGQRDAANQQPDYSLEGLDEQIYVLTPQARVIELPAGATPIDFAYHLHTDLGHRCRGARIDNAMVPLNTPLKNGQTVEIITVKRGAPAIGPSRDWLNSNLNYIKSNRARQKIRQWFNALELAESISLGRSQVEKILQRVGKTAINLEELASRLGFDSTDDFYIAVEKDLLGSKRIEIALQGGDMTAETNHDPGVTARKHRAPATNYASNGVLVVGMGSLLTQLAKCCKPAPPDPIIGFVTRGKGVSIHRETCTNFREMLLRAPERVVQTTWGQAEAGNTPNSIYPVDIVVQAQDRQGLLRDISEVFAREKINVIGVNTQTIKHIALMQFTAEVSSSSQLQKAIALIAEVNAVLSARRK